MTPCAKEEHYTAAPCHAGRHHPHSGFNFPAFFPPGIGVHIRLCACVRREEKNHCEGFLFSLSPSQQNVCQPPTSSSHTRQSGISLCKVKNSEKNKKTNLETQLAKHKNIHMSCILESCRDSRCRDSLSSAPCKTGFSEQVSGVLIDFCRRLNVS